MNANGAIDGDDPRGRARAPTHARRTALRTWLLLGACLCACSLFRGDDRSELCLQVTASRDLNSYEGEPHAVALYVFPLESTTAFEEADADELRADEPVAGMTGEKLDLTIVPGEVRDLRGPVDERTRFVGVLADFFNGPSKLLLQPGCQKGKPRRVELGAREAGGDGRPARRGPAPTRRRSSGQE